MRTWNFAGSASLAERCREDNAFAESGMTLAYIYIYIYIYIYTYVERDLMYIYIYITYLYTQ